MKIRIMLITIILMFAQNIYSDDNTSVASNYEHEVSICAIFRDEARFLKEWIEYHILLGVERFYLYNNLSEDEYLTVLTPYMECGVVQLTELPYEHTNMKEWEKIQTDAYNDCINNHAKFKTKWLCLIDTDEFILPVNQDSLPLFLKDYEDFGGLCINWQFFGTSNVEKIRSDQLMIEEMVRKGKKDLLNCRWVKPIVRPELVETVRTSHVCFYKTGFFCVDENKKLSLKGWTEKISVEKIRLNHYWTRDEHFFYEKKIAGIINFLPVVIESCYKLKELYNHENDYIIHRFVPRLKKQMGMKFN